MEPIPAALLEIAQRMTIPDPAADSTVTLSRDQLAALQALISGLIGHLQTQYTLCGAEA